MTKRKEYEVQSTEVQSTEVQRICSTNTSLYGDVVFVREKDKISDHAPTADLIHIPQPLAIIPLN